MSSKFRQNSGWNKYFTQNKRNSGNCIQDISILSKWDLVIFNVPDERMISIPNQVRILHGFHVEFSFLDTKHGFLKVLWTNPDLHFASS